MKHVARDQADGLRRMLTGPAGQVLLLAGPACDAALQANLAAALGGLGRTVAVVDGPALARLGAAGVDMLQTMRAEADTLLLGGGIERTTTMQAIAAFHDQADQLLVAFADVPDGIKQSYLLLKGLPAAAAGTLPVRVLVTEARSAQSALHMYGNLAATVRQYLGADIALAGYIPADTHLALARTLDKPVVEAFAAAPAALACRQVAREIASWRAAAALPAAAWQAPMRPAVDLARQPERID